MKNLIELKIFKNLIKKFILNKSIAKKLEKVVLNIHTIAYNLSGALTTVANDGIHPKHRIMNYEKWFLDNIKDKWVVIDIGSNIGLMAEILSEKADFVYGIEIEKDLVLKAKDRVKKDNVYFIHADATKFNYLSLKPIDCVTLSNVLEHIKGRVEFLKELNNNIKWKNKKRYLIRVPMRDRDWITIYKKELGLEYRLDKSHFIEYTFEEFAEELRLANIKIIQYNIRFGEIYAICEGM